MILALTTSILGILAAFFALGKAKPSLHFKTLLLSKRYEKSVKFFKLADGILDDVNQAMQADGEAKCEARAYLPLVVSALKRCELMKHRRSFSVFVREKKIESYLDRLKAEELRLNMLPKFASYEDFMREVV